MHWTWNWEQKRLMKRVDVEAVKAGRRRPAPWRKTGVVVVEATVMASNSRAWSGWGKSEFSAWSEWYLLKSYSVPTSA